MKENSDRAPDLLLERYVLGELSDKEALELSKRMETEPGLAERVAGIKISDEAILSEYPAELMASKIRARHSQEERGLKESRMKQTTASIRWMTYAFGGAAALACAVFLIFPAFFPVQTDGVDIRVKGPFELSIFRQTNGGFEKLSDGTKVRRGDRFQVKYRAGNEGFGVIFSIDGRGGVTLHYPQDSKVSAALDKKGEVALLDAFELDDAPGFERFFFVVSGKEFQVVDVLGKGRELAADKNRALSGELELGAGLSQASFSLIKEGYR